MTYNMLSEKLSNQPTNVGLLISHTVVLQGCQFNQRDITSSLIIVVICSVLHTTSCTETCMENVRLTLIIVLTAIFLLLVK